MSGYDKSYYEKRAMKSRELAAAAADPEIASIHLEMAQQYDLLAASNARTPAGQSPLRIVAG